MKIGIDLDSTLNDLDVKWAAWIQENLDPEFSREKWTGWNLHELTPAGNAIYDYLEVPGTFANLEPKEGSQEVVQDLVEAGHRVYIPTACYLKPGREHVLVDKLLWVEKNYPQVDVKDFIPIQDKGLLKLDVLIDDGPHNFEEFDGQKLLIDGPWNHAEGDKYDRAHGWADVRRWLQNQGIL